MHRGGDCDINETDGIVSCEQCMWRRLGRPYGGVPVQAAIPIAIPSKIRPGRLGNGFREIL